MTPAILRQGSPLPMFACEALFGEDLLCAAGCGQILIKGFKADCFAGVSIECFNCAHVTETPPFPVGEVFPAYVMSLDSKKTYLLDGTTHYDASQTTASSTEIKKSIEDTSPKAPEYDLIMNDQTVHSLIDVYQAATRSDLGLQLRIAARGGKDNQVRYPFAWAINYLNSPHSSDAFETIAAWKVLAMFASTNAAWSHHPRYELIAQQLTKRNSFYHTVFTFMAAHFLHQSGNKIGLSLEDKHGEPNPDLYIRQGNNKNIYIEVKAPDILQVTSFQDDPSLKIDWIIKETAKRVHRQINKNKPGILFIGTSYIFKDIGPEIDRCRINTTRSIGRLNSGLAAIMTVRPDLPAPNRADIFRFQVSTNPSFDGENPVQLT